MIRGGVTALRLRMTGWTPDRFEKSVIGILAIFFALILIIAWVAPINNNDSLQYHMSRVAHWAQAHSLEHYPTAYPPQLFNAIFAESVILHIYQLAGGDKAANLVQVFFFAGTLILTVLCAKAWAVNRRGQLLTALFAATIPLAILEAPTTQNDLVAAFWNMGIAYFSIKAAQQGLGRDEILLVGLCVGLGFSTKGTFNTFALPFLLWMLISLLRRPNFRRTLASGAAAVGLALVLNLGFLVRNFQTFNNPIASAEFLEYKSPNSSSPQALLVNIVQSSALQIRTPFMGVNARMAEGISRFCELLGQTNCRQVSDKTFYLPLLSNQEDTAGSPLQFTLGLFVVMLAFLPSKVPDRHPIRLFALAGLVGLLLVMVTIEWEIYATRYHLAFLFLMAPVFGVFTQRISSATWHYILVAVLVSGALPFLLFSRARPLIGLTPNITLTKSIFIEKPVNLILVFQEVYNDSAIQVARVFEKTGCTEVGLRIDSNDPEYIFWKLLNVKEENIRMEIVNPDPYSARYVDPGFHPCAVICTICAEKTPLMGVPFFFKDHGVTLYLAPEYQFQLLGK
jgi:4-amino-4-deoxy-L-arabinose transferase-like glycosyltransferase